MHFMDMIVVAVVGLLIFGPKALQGMAHSAGKSVNQAKELKDKLFAELPMDEIREMSNAIPRVPLNSQQALQMLITPESSEKQQEMKPETPTAPQSVQQFIAGSVPAEKTTEVKKEGT